MSFKAEDEVYSLTYRRGEVIIYNTSKDDLYMVKVQFDNGTIETYTKEGKLFQNDDLVDLYHGKPQIIAPPDPKRNPKFEIDDKLLVRNESSPDWYPAHFKGWTDSGNIICWGQGTTSFTSTCYFAGGSIWDEYKLPED